MTGLIVFFVIALIIGALLGGKFFGESFRNGCGCITFMIIAVVVMIILGLFILFDS